MYKKFTNPSRRVSESLLRMQRRASVGRFIKDVSAPSDGLGLNRTISEDIYSQKYVFEVAWEVVNKGMFYLTSSNNTQYTDCLTCNNLN